MIFMSKAKYDVLSPAARKIIGANSGEAQSRAFGQVMEDEDKAQRAAVKAMPNQTFVTPTPAQVAGWQKKIAPVIDQWTKVVPSGDVVLAQFKKNLADVKAGH